MKERKSREMSKYFISFFHFLPLPCLLRADVAELFSTFSKRSMSYYIRHIFPIRSYSPALLRILLRRTPSPGRTTRWRGSLSQSGGRTRPKVRKDRTALISFLYLFKEISLEKVFGGNLFNRQFSINIFSIFLNK